MKNKWLIIAVLVPSMCFSQGNNTKGKMTAITSAGFAAGESIAKPLFQVSGGWSYRNQFAGIGIGYDAYRFNTFPLFADWRMTVTRTHNAFLYANTGYNFPGKYSTPENDFVPGEKLRGGFYMDAGLGYRVPVSPRHRLLFSAGYSQKNTKIRSSFVIPCLVPPCSESVTISNYQLGRIVTKLSWEFAR